MTAAYTPSDQWRGLYAGRPEDQKMVNAKALARLIEDHNRYEAALTRIERLSRPTGGFGRVEYSTLAGATEIAREALRDDD